MRFPLPDWRKLLRTARPLTGDAMLDRRHVYILPTRFGVGYAVMLLMMLVGAINYSLSLGFVLTFLLGGLGIVALLHTWRNLANVTVSPGRSLPVFLGEDAVFPLTLSDPSGRTRYAIGVQCSLGEPAYCDVAAKQRGEVMLPRKTHRRGWMNAGRVTVFTEFPLGLFRAWSYVEFGQRCLVYPAPANPGLPLPAATPGDREGKAQSSAGNEDFAGLRGYLAGDSPRRVDWKAYARAQGLLTKQYEGMTQASLWLDGQLLPGHGAEDTLRHLTRWVLDAEAEGAQYGLRLPGLEIAPGSGEAHRQRCLEALALASP